MFFRAFGLQFSQTINIISRALLAQRRRALDSSRRWLGHKIMPAPRAPHSCSSVAPLSLARHAGVGPAGHSSAYSIVFFFLSESDREVWKGNDLMTK